MKRLLLVGWDAADWRIIDPILSRGELPHLAGLIENGVRGNLASLYPSLSPMLWTSIATGKRQHKHGIAGFLEPMPDAMGIRPVTNLGRKTKAVWNILNQYGKRSVIVGWWPSHPAEPIQGAMVSEHFKLSLDDPCDKPLMPGTIFPKSWAERLAPLRVHPSEISSKIIQLFVPEPMQVDQSNEHGLRDLAGFIADTMTIHAAATELLAHETWDFAAVYYNAIDHFCHRFMHYHAHPTGEQPAGLEKAIIENAYRHHDGMLGQLIALAGADCTVMLISDHGFHSNRMLPEYLPAVMDGPAIEHRDLGIFCMRGAGVKSHAPIYGAGLLDIAPTILQLFDLPIGMDMDGRPLFNALVDPRPHQPIPTWDEVPGDNGQHSHGYFYDGAASVGSMQQLIALGYVAPPSPDKKQDVDRCLMEWDYNRACALLDMNRPDLAAEIFRELVGRDDGDGRFHQGLADCLLATGELAECARVLDHFDECTMRVSSLAADDLSRRRAICSDKELMADTRGHAWNELRERQHLEERVHAFKGERALLRCRLATRLSKTLEGKLAAEALFQQFEPMLASRPEPCLFMAESRSIFGDNERALRLVRSLQVQDAEDWRSIALEAHIHYSEGRLDQAVNCAIRSLALVYCQPLLHCLLGLSFAALGEHGLAEEELYIADSQMPGLIASRPEVRAVLCSDTVSNPRTEQNGKSRNSSEGFRLMRVQNKQPASRSAGILSYTAFERLPDVPAAKIERAITVVTGLPRSGTSMMMQMLAAGGLEPYTDGKRLQDESNSRGYFEHTEAARLHQDASWIHHARGKAVKIVAQLLPYLPSGEEYRIVFMHRDLREVVASQEVMLKRLGRSGGNLQVEQMIRTYMQQIMRVQTWLRLHPGIHVLAINYCDAVANPLETGERLTRLLGVPFNMGAAAGVVEASLQHQKFS